MNKLKVASRRVSVKGQRMVLVAERDYESLLRKARASEPDLPAPNADGNYPALATLDVLQARDILRARRKLGMTQVELASMAGVRVETLNRIEKGKNVASIPTIAKIEAAIEKASAKVRKANGNVTKKE